VPTVRELIDSGRAIHERLEFARQSMESRRTAGLVADWEHVPLGRTVAAHELPEWYLRCFRALRATYGKGSPSMAEWTDYLRSAREARPHLDESDPLQVMRAGIDDLAGAIDVLRRIESRLPIRGGGRPTITVGPSSR
jgi:hypothetical protein